MVLHGLKNAVSFVPVLGPARDAIESVSAGDKLGAGIALGRLLSDASSIGGSRVIPAIPVRRLAGQVGHVLKHTLKRRVRNRTREAVLKVGLTAAAASIEQLKAPFGPIPKLISAPCLQFSDVCSADAQFHARLALRVYSAPSERSGLLTSSMQIKGVVTSGDFWYAYVGGDARRGFWYCPCHGGHLVLAERGTQLVDPQDLARDAWIALGSSTALRSRVEESLEQLREQCLSHSSFRVTATGHSLGGAVAAGLAGRGLGALGGLEAVHLFNPGGLPDLARYLSWAPWKKSCDLKVHRIVGDPISVGFLPVLQQNYSKKVGLEALDSHSLKHFLTAD
eukprot:Skav232475  [mRNA]  locus=scaffold2877:175697:176707:+ [translate_table: standard]